MSTALHWRGILPKAVFFENAAKYAKAAARRAQRAGAFTDAIAHANTLIYSLEQLPLTPENQKQIIDARTVLANYFIILNYHLEAKEAVEPIVDMTVALDYRKRLPGIYVVLGSYYVAVEKFDKAYQYLNLAIDMAEKTGDWFNLWNGNYFLGVALSTECQFEKAIDCFNTSLQLSEIGNNLHGIAFVKGTMSAFALSFFGKIDTASVLSRKAVQAAEKCADAHTIGTAYATHGSVCFFKGDFEWACRFLTEAIDLCRKSGHLLWRGWAEFYLANTYFFTRCYKEAIEFCTRATSTMNDMGQAQQWMPYAMLALQRAILVNGGTITPLPLSLKPTAGKTNLK